jgi:branched-chain amino acid transport system ATP-binding protein
MGLRPAIPCTNLRKNFRRCDRENAVEFRNIRIVYDNAIEAIRDVSIAVPEGGIVALLGSNGAGKSTLLKAMSGILHTEEGAIENGAIRFCNEDVHR